MAANMEVLANAARDFLGRSRALLLDEDNHHPVNIASVRDIERDLQLSVAAIRQYYNASPFAPINRLHAELLGMIFQYIREPSKPAIPAYPDRGRFDSYKRLLAPMLVCHKWHTLITQDATLWNEIDLVEHDLTGTFVQNMLARSKAASLDIRLPYPGFVKDGRKKITSFLQKNAHRFSKLEVKLQRADRTSKMLPLLDVSMPRLACLVISLIGKDDLPKNVHTMSFARFPGLKALALSGIVLRPKERVASLTHLHLVSLVNDSISPLLDMLRAAPSLEVLDLSKIKLTVQNVKQAHLPLPHLRMLRISHRTWSSVAHFLLTNLVAPNLAVAHLSHVDNWSHGNADGVVKAYIPPTFLNERPFTRFKIRECHMSPGFTAILEGPDFELTLEESSTFSDSILAITPLPECLGGVEDACIDLRELSYIWAPTVWLAERLPKAKSLVFTFLCEGLPLLKHPKPILFPELESLGLDARYGELGDIACALKTRAQLVGRSLPVLRLGGSADLLNKKLSDEAQVKEYVDKVEVVGFASQESLWIPRQRPSAFGKSIDHGYWADSDTRFDR